MAPRSDARDDAFWAERRLADLERGLGKAAVRVMTGRCASSNPWLLDCELRFIKCYELRRYDKGEGRQALHTFYECGAVHMKGQYESAESHYRMLADALPQMVWVMQSGTGRCSYSNQRFDDFYGVIGIEREARVLRNHPEDAPRMEEAWRKALSDRAVYVVEGRLQRSDGVYRWHKLVMVPILRGDNLDEWLGTALDVDEIVTARRDLADTTDLLRLVQDAANGGEWIWDLKRNSVWLSPRCARLNSVVIGPQEEAARGVVISAAQWAQAIVSEDHARVWAEAKHAIGTGARLDVEFRVRSPAGGLDGSRWIQALGRVIYDPVSGKPIRIVGLDLDISDRKENEERIERMARFDGLTNLANRKTFYDALRYRFEDRALAPGFAILAVDLDKFKFVNDTLGHPIGDTILRVIAERMKEIVNSEDLLARMGGDEFAVIHSAGAVPHAAASLAERLIAAIGEPIVLQDQELVVGASIGIALAPADGSGVEQLFRAADLALLRAKSDRNTYRFFEQKMDDAARLRLELERDLRGALSRGEFELHYQPIVKAVTKTVVSFEALVRWRHPTRGLVAPLDFIPMAEQTRLILPIGDWILRTACHEAKRWRNIAVAVNVSAIQFTEPGFPLAVASALAASGLPAHRLELEITETALMQEELALANFEKLKFLGVGIALDDFGTGYSSLSYLRRMPFDRIKLDRSFVSDIGDHRSAAIVQAVVHLAQAIGMAITAEGVETDEQFASACRMGCTEIQGYLVGKPVGADEAGPVAMQGEVPCPRLAAASLLSSRDHFA